MVLIKRETEIETATVDSKTFLFRKPELDNKAAKGPVQNTWHDF